MGEFGKLRGKELMKALSELYSEIDQDPEMREKSEKYQKEYGTLNEKELRRQCTF